MYLGVSGELSPASVYVSLLPVVEARVVVVAVPGRVGMTNHPPNNLNSTKSRHIALREFQVRIRDYHEHGIIRPYWCPGNYNVADFFSELLEKGLFTMHAYRFGMNFQV